MNDAPTVNGQTFGTATGHLLLVSGPGLLSAAADVEGNALSLVILQAPLHGTLVSQVDGSFRYMPNDGFAGSDSFEFAVSDGALLSESQTARVDVYAPSAGSSGSQAAPAAGTSGNAVSTGSHVTLNTSVIATVLAVFMLGLAAFFTARARSCNGSPIAWV